MGFSIGYFICGFIACAIGLIIGCTWTTHLFAGKYLVGELRVDRSDEDGPFCFMALKPDCGDFINKDNIMLKVKREDFLPRK